MNDKAPDTLVSENFDGKAFAGLPELAKNLKAFQYFCDNNFNQ